MSSKNIIEKYYSSKIPEYNKKYKLAYYTHLHTGIYSSDNYPAIVKNKIDFNKYDINYLKYLLNRGQESLIHYLNKFLLTNNTKNVLDLGAGHGATSIFLAEHFNLKIKALTISSEQEQEIIKNIKKSGTKNVKTIYSDIIDYAPKNNLYDKILAIESLCHIKCSNKLFAKINSLLSKSGSLIVSDYFVSPKQKEVKNHIDAYWHTNINYLNLFLKSAELNGLTLRHIENLSLNQIPFWRLSSAYSAKKISDNKLTDSDIERLNNSKKFHDSLIEYFDSKKINYYLIVFDKLT